MTAARGRGGPMAPAMTTEPTWLNTEQAVAYLSLPSRKALYQAVRRGQIPVHRLGPRRMRFRRVELDSIISGKGQR